MDILLRAFARSRHLTEQREASKSNCVLRLRIPKKTSDRSFLWSFPKEPSQGTLSDVLLGILSCHTLSDSLPAWPNVMLSKIRIVCVAGLNAHPPLYHWALQYFHLPLAWLSQCECASNTFQVLPIGAVQGSLIAGS